MLFNYLNQFIIPTTVNNDKSRMGEKTPQIGVWEPWKHHFQFVRFLGASLSPASQPKQITKFYKECQ